MNILIETLQMRERIYLKSILLSAILLCSTSSYAQYYSNELLRKAESGNAVSQYILGFCYLSGDGVEQNYVEAAKWYRRAAEQGYAAAQYSLGKCYENGYGVTKNLVSAVKWYRRAAEQGYEEAQIVLQMLGY